MKKIINLAICSLILAATGVTNSVEAQFADLKATFVFKGKAPDAAAVQAVNDPVCGTFKIVSETLVVNKTNNGIKDLAIFPDPKTFDPTKADPAVKEPIVAKPVLDNNMCRFDPHVLVVKSGQDVVVKNSDKTGHNASFSFFSNNASNNQIPAGGMITFKVPLAEPAPIPVSCGSHGWMKAFVIVQDHPFVGLSDENGLIQIKGLPVGKISLKIWQDSGKFKEVKINGKALPVKRGAFEIELKAGMNDLGKIELDASNFS
jgi:plastocyanin